MKGINTKKTDENGYLRTFTWLSQTRAQNKWILNELQINEQVIRVLYSKTFNQCFNIFVYINRITLIEFENKLC